MLCAGVMLPSGDSECVRHLVTCTEKNIFILWPLTFELGPYRAMIKGYFVQVNVPKHSHRRTQLTDCYTWTTKVDSEIQLPIGLGACISLCGGFFLVSCVLVNLWLTQFVLVYIFLLCIRTEQLWKCYFNSVAWLIKAWACRPLSACRT